MKQRQGISSKRGLLGLIGFGCSFLALVMLICWAITISYSLRIAAKCNRGDILAEASHGVFHFQIDQSNMYANFPVQWNFRATPARLIAPWRDIFSMRHQPHALREVGMVDVRLPFVVFFAMFVSAGYLAFWRSRTLFPPGHCGRCGYNLFGISSRRCPECGGAVEEVKVPDTGPESRRILIARRLARFGAGASIVVLFIAAMGAGTVWMLRQPAPTAKGRSATMLPMGYWGVPSGFSQVSTQTTQTTRDRNEESDDEQDTRILAYAHMLYHITFGANAEGTTRIWPEDGGWIVQFIGKDGVRIVHVPIDFESPVRFSEGNLVP